MFSTPVARYWTKFSLNWICLSQFSVQSTLAAVVPFLLISCSSITIHLEVFLFFSFVIDSHNHVLGNLLSNRWCFINNSIYGLWYNRSRSPLWSLAVVRWWLMPGDPKRSTYCNIRNLKIHSCIVLWDFRSKTPTHSYRFKDLTVYRCAFSKKKRKEEGKNNVSNGQRIYLMEKLNRYSMGSFNRMLYFTLNFSALGLRRIIQKNLCQCDRDWSTWTRIPKTINDQH